MQPQKDFVLESKVNTLVLAVEFECCSQIFISIEVHLCLGGMYIWMMVLLSEWNALCPATSCFWHGFACNSFLSRWHNKIFTLTQAQPSTVIYLLELPTEFWDHRAYAEIYKNTRAICKHCSKLPLKSLLIGNLRLRSRLVLEARRRPAF